MDLTIGLGGHASYILERLDNITLIAVDCDEYALELARKNLSKFQNKTNLIFIHDNFANIKDIHRRLNYPKIDAILMDLGVSSMQLDNEKRGFSFLKNAFIFQKS